LPTNSRKSLSTRFLGFRHGDVKRGR